MGDNFVSRPMVGMGVMSKEEKERLHKATLEVLERVGVEFHDEEALKIFKAHGAKVEGGVAKIPASLVEKALGTAPGKIVIYDRNGQDKLHLEPGRFYFGTGSDTPYALDFETDQIRMAVLDDTVKAATVCDALPNIDFIMSMGLASDAPVRISDIYQYVAMLKNSIKPMILTAHNMRNLEIMLQIDELAIGGPVGDKPNIMLYNEPSSPLRHAEEVAQKALLAADRHIPITYVPAVMMSGSGPVTLAGSLVIANSELLSGLVLHQLRGPGAPFIYGGAATPLDMRTGGCCYCAPEGHINSVYLAEMARHYNLPVFAWGGCSDAVTFDHQATMEGSFTLLMNALNGANLIHDVGFLGSGMVASIEMIVASNETIGLVKRIVRGADLSEEKLSVDTICSVGIGGSYLETDHTGKYFREELWIPELINRTYVPTWLASNRDTFASNIKKKIRRTLDEHKPQPLDKGIERQIDDIVSRA